MLYTFLETSSSLSYFLIHSDTHQSTAFWFVSLTLDLTSAIFFESFKILSYTFLMVSPFLISASVFVVGSFSASIVSSISVLRLLYSSCTWNLSPITVLDINASIPLSMIFSAVKKSLIFENFDVYSFTISSTILMAFALPVETPETPDLSITSKALLDVTHIILLSIGNVPTCCNHIRPGLLKKYFFIGEDLTPSSFNSVAFKLPS